MPAPHRGTGGLSSHPPKVYFGDNEASVQSSSPDQIDVTAPAPSSGLTRPKTVDVTVLSNGYSSPANPADEFRAPKI